MNIYNNQTRSLCATISFIIRTAKRASLLSLALIKIDKVVYIFCHHHYKRWFRARNCVAFSLFVWSASGYREIVNVEWFLIDSMVFFVLPSIIAVLGTGCLFCRSNHDPEAGVSAYTSLWTTLWFLGTLMPVKIYYGCKWAHLVEDDWTEFAFLCLESFNAVVNPMIAITVQEKYLHEVRGMSLFFWRV